jgi:flagellar hook-associated protein 2
MSTSPVTNTNSANFITALGTGSGVDIRALAQNLVNAEREPKAALIQRSIDRAQARSTGYEIVLKALGQVQSALDGLASASAFSNFSTASSQPSAVTISGSPTAASGSYQIKVSALAQPQRTASDEVPSGVQGAGGPYSVTIVPSGQGSIPLSIQVQDTSPEGIAAAINQQGWPYTASLVGTSAASGGAVRVVLTGPTGTDGAFNITVRDASNSPALTFSNVQAAQNAALTINNIPISRSTNQIEGAIAGATLSLTDTTTGNGALVSLTHDISTARDKIRQLVSNYNDLQAIIDASLDPNSAVEKLGGSLVGDPTIRGIRDRIRAILMPMSGSSAGTVDGLAGSLAFAASGSQSFSGLRDLGIIIDTDGRMKFSSLKTYDAQNPNQPLVRMDDESQLNAALNSSYAEVAALFQGRSGRPGIASDMSDLIAGSGRYMDTSFTPSSPTKLIIATQRNTSGAIRVDQQRLSVLEDRMKMLLDRYLKQFAVMDSLVGQSKSIRTGVENSFKGMSSSR